MSSLNIATRALNANLAALQVIGHNIANVNTAGYSRQTVLLQSSGYQSTGGGYFGKGVEIGTVERAHSEYLTREARLTASVASSDAARLQRLEQLESIFPTGSQGLGVALNDMLNAWTDLGSAPGNLTARMVVITRAEEFASRLRDSAGQLDLLRKSTQQQVGSMTDNVNRLAKDLAKVNERIVSTAGSSHTPNDLYDQRDQLLRELSSLVQITTVPGEANAVNVFVGGSQPLVLGANAAALTSEPDPMDSSRSVVRFVQGGVAADIPDGALGGSLGGVLSFLNQDLGATQNQLGRMALATATLVNGQHALGMTLQGNAGANMFVPPAAALGVPAPTNLGTGAVSASVSNPQALVASDYELRVEAGGFNIVRLSDGASTAVASLPTELDGLNFQIDTAGLAAGDVFRLRPYDAAARDLKTSISSPEHLAVSSPVMVAPGAGNSGSLSVESLYASQASPNLSDPVTITFNADGSFSATGLGPDNPPPDNPGPPASYNFTPGQAIVLNGWSLTLRGTPTAGDSFSVGAATLGSTTQNSGNASAMLGLRSLATFDGVSLSDGYVSLFSELGTRVQSAQFAADFSASVATAAEQARAGMSGVNLDEEAARLLQFQQAYQASAKFLQIAQGTFDSLMQVVGR